MAADSGDIEEPLVADVNNVAYILTEATVGMYEKLLNKFGTKMANKYLKNSSQDDIDSFVERLRQSQSEKLRERLSLIMNRVSLDSQFLKALDGMLEEHETVEELECANETAINHIQSVENERSTLLRETEQTIEKVEDNCQRLMEQIIKVFE